MRSNQRSVLLFVALATLQLLIGCSRSNTASTTLRLATTTSTQESGLLDALIPKFREQTGIDVHVVAVGSGQALELGRRGDADVLLTHAPAAEQKFMDEGWAAERRAVMYNDFVLVGPKSDPAGISGQASIVESFARIADQAAPFVSRGDDSGTHQKEKEIWQKASRDPNGDWYIRAGTGMSQALRMADEKQAYTLSDRATFLTLQKELELQILVQRDPMMQNNYAVLIVSPEKHPHIKSQGARKFADFLTSPATQKFISEFGVAKFGEPLFFPKK
jgi:tungstate transport system substrate-binding protein